MEPNTNPQVQSVGAKKSNDIRRAELERKSRDLWKIYNPTNQAFQIALNIRVSPEIWTIEAKSEAVVPSYVKEKYFQEMADKIITSKSDKAVIEENEKRREKGFAAMDLHTEQFRFESRNLKNMMSKRDQIVTILNRGLYQEYGISGGNNATSDIKRENKKDFEPGIDVGGQPISNQPMTPPVKEGTEPPLEQPIEVKMDNTVPEPQIKDFTCDVCDKTVSSAIALSGHKRSHKAQEEPKVVIKEDE